MGEVKLAKGYKPKKSETYMNEKQLEYFRQKLLDWRQSLLDESQQTINQMRDSARDVSDEAERASREAEITFELRTRDRYRKLLSKIDQGLKRIDDESYGFCDETDEPIGLDRLEARPIATLTIEAQERREQLERQYGDR
jgi:DnaK suppressor protein